MAQYRAGDWKAAQAALEKTIELRKGGDGSDWFLVAMCHEKLGDKEKARQWYDQAKHWMDKNPAENEELWPLRAEAGEVLKIAESLQVTAVSLKAEPEVYRGPASPPPPVWIAFRGKITVNGPCTVKYRFLFGDKASSPVHTLTFEKPGVKEVTQYWSRLEPSWVALQVLAPNEITSEKAPLKDELRK